MARKMKFQTDTYFPSWGYIILHYANIWLPFSNLKM